MPSPSLIPLRDLTRADYDKLAASGVLWELYPNASGDYAADTKPMGLRELNEAMHGAYAQLSKTPAYPERRAAEEAVSKLYSDHFHKAIMAEGFNAAQASLIDSEAYDRGHSAGHQEVVCCAMSLVEFARRLIAAK